MRLVCSDQTNIYCGLQGGIILVFLADTLLYVTRLEEKNSHLWQLQVIMMMMMMMISELFQEDWLAEHGLNASLLREYFDRSSHHYCEAGGIFCQMLRVCSIVQL